LNPFQHFCSIKSSFLPDLARKNKTGQISR